MMKEKPKRLKGTVLFTVVSVMMVMVVFLLGTLALAATASNRAYSNYQKEQTEYTSRAVLDSVVQAINDNTEIRSAVLGMPTNEMDVTVGVDDGSGNEEYTVHVQKSTTNHKSYDTTKGKWLDGSEYLLSVTVGKTMAQTTYTAKMAGVVQPAAVTNNPGGAFVSLGDTGDNEIATHGYTTGGSYIGVGTKKGTYSLSAAGDMVVDAPFYLNGSLGTDTAFGIHFTRAKDFMVVMGDLTIGSNQFVVNYEGFDVDTQMKVNGSNIYENSPYIYVDGTIYGPDTTLTIGEKDSPLQIYAGSVELINQPTIYGDLYTFNGALTNSLDTSGSGSQLYKWTSQNIKRTDETGVAVNGSWFSKGEIDISGAGSKFDGDIRCENNITISGETKVGGNIVCSDILKVASGTLNCDGDIYADVVIVNGTINCKNLKANTIIGSGTINSTSAECVSSNMPKLKTQDKIWYDVKRNSGDNITEVRTWYSDYKLWHDSDPDAGTYYLSYSVLQHTTTKYNNSSPEEVTNEITETAVQNYDITDRDPAITEGEKAGGWLFSNYKIAYATKDSWENYDTAVVNHGYYNSYTVTEHKITTYNDGTTVESTNVFGENLTSTKKMPDFKKYKEEYEKYDSEENAKTVTYDLPAGVPNATPPITLRPDTKTVEAMYGKEIYPKNYTEDHLEQYVIEQPTGSAYQYPDDISELGVSDDVINNPKKQGDLTKEKDANNKEYCVVNSDCVLTDNFSENIYVSAANPIVIILDNFSLEIGHTIIVDDKNLVTFFIKNTASLGQRSGIITVDYLNKFRGSNWKKGEVAASAAMLVTGMKDVEIMQNAPRQEDGSLSEDYPNVIIYGGTGYKEVTNYTDPDGNKHTEEKDCSRLDIGINSVITAQVRAQTLIFHSSAGDPNLPGNIKYITAGTLTYGSSPSIDCSSCKSLGLIGQLIAGSIQIPSDGSWGMLYVTDGGSNNCPCMGSGCGCTGAPNCECKCASCICKTSNPSPTPGTPTKYSVMYYEYY